MRKKILLNICFFSAAICITLCSISCFIIYDNQKNNMEESVISSAIAYTESVTRAINNYKIKAEAIAMNDSITNVDFSVNSRKAFLSGLSSKYGFKDISVSDENGLTYDNTYINDAAYFKSAIDGTTYISSPELRDTDNSIMMFVSAKVKNDTRYNGIIFAALDYRIFNQVIESINIGEMGYGYILDKNGTLIAHNDKDLVSSFTNYISLSENDSSLKEIAEVHEAMIAGETDQKTYMFNNVKKFTSFRPIPGTDGWSLGVTVDVDEMMSGFYSSLYLMIVVSIVFLIISCVMAYLIANPIAKPIVEISKRIELLADGDLKTIVPEITSKDELGILSRSTTKLVDSLSTIIDDISYNLGEMSCGNMDVEPSDVYTGDLIPIKSEINNIIYSLNNVLYDINEASDQVANGSVQVAVSAQALSQGSTEQASSIEELSSTVSEISEQVKLNAENAKDSSIKALELGKELEKSNNKMQLMIDAMNDINESSGKIGKIIKTINDIAFQTNILALNAAVEAARAGSLGKGFAVVADEVRNLAAKSSEAVKDTEALIDSSIKSVEKGTRIANDTADSLNNVFIGSKDIVDNINQISQASNEQANFIIQIMEGIDQISSVVQTNSATAEESAAASEELSSQAKLMRDLVEKFKLKNKENIKEKYNEDTDTKEDIQEDTQVVPQEDTQENDQESIVEEM